MTIQCDRLCRKWRKYATDSAAGTHWVGGWVCPRAALDVVAYRKNPLPLP